MEKKYTKLDYSVGYVPPQAIDLEQVVLAALMLERDAITRVDIVPEVFYKDEHRKIFEVIRDLDNNGKNIDLMTVTLSIKDRGLLDELGGAGYITQMTNRVASSAHLEQHVSQLIQYFVRRELIRVSNEILRMAYDTNNDISDIMELYEKTVTEIDRILIGKNTGRELFNILEDLTDEVERRRKLSQIGGLTGVDTGFAPLNKYTSGWQPNWMIIFAARPAMGKTAIAINRFAKVAARTGKWVNIFSLEMDDISLAERLVIGASGIDTYAFRSGKLTDADWTKYNHALSELQRLPIYIDDSPFVKISHIRNVARTNKRQNKCDLIIIDYLQLADAGTMNRNGTREQQVSDMSRRLKALAKELGVPIIVLSQLSRAVESRSDKMPVLSDLRESGSIEQDADMVIFPFRPNYYKDDIPEGMQKNEGVLIVAKNRHGATGNIPFYHNETMTDFSDEPFGTHIYDMDEFTSMGFNDEPF